MGLGSKPQQLLVPSSLPFLSPPPSPPPPLPTFPSLSCSPCSSSGRTVALLQPKSWSICLFWPLHSLVTAVVMVAALAGPQTLGQSCCHCYWSRLGQEQTCALCPQSGVEPEHSPAGARKCGDGGAGVDGWAEALEMGGQAEVVGRVAGNCCSSNPNPGLGPEVQQLPASPLNSSGPCPTTSACHCFTCCSSGGGAQI